MHGTPSSEHPHFDMEVLHCAEQHWPSVVQAPPSEAHLRQGGGPRAAEGERLGFMGSGRAGGSCNRAAATAAPAGYTPRAVAAASQVTSQAGWGLAGHWAAAVARAKRSSALTEGVAAGAAAGVAAWERAGVAREADGGGGVWGALGMAGAAVAVAAVCMCRWRGWGQRDSQHQLAAAGAAACGAGQQPVLPPGQQAGGARTWVAWAWGVVGVVEAWASVLEAWAWGVVGVAEAWASVSEAWAEVGVVCSDRLLAAQREPAPVGGRWRRARARQGQQHRPIWQQGKECS